MKRSLVWWTWMFMGFGVLVLLALSKMGSFAKSILLVLILGIIGYIVSSSSKKKNPFIEEEAPLNMENFR